jgi:hypothetical protein
MENNNITSMATMDVITQEVSVIKRIAFTSANMKNLTMMAFDEFYDSDLNTADKLSAMVNKMVSEYYKSYITRLANKSNEA